MIHRCRPDIEVGLVWEEARRALTCRARGPQRVKTLGGRTLFSAPSGRGALRWFLNKIGIGPGDEVAVPALVCEVVADVVVACGARPVTYGISSDKFSPSVQCCDQALSQRTKVVILPHLYGIPADLEGFRAICGARGILLVEDCAQCVCGQSGRYEVGSAGDCSIYSFAYGKPLSVGWGGGLSLSDQMLTRLGSPEFPPITDGEDRLVALSCVLQHSLTDSDRPYGAFLKMNYVLERLCLNPQLVDEATSLIIDGNGLTRLSAWCNGHLLSGGRGSTGRIISSVRRLCARATPAAIKRLVRSTRPSRGDAHTNGAYALLGARRLPDEGVSQHLLAVQDREVRRGESSAARVRKARVYQSGLDRGRMVVPDIASVATHPLWFPIALHEGRSARDAFCDRIRRRLHVEVGPYNWPTPIHLIPRFRGVVRLGPGSRETEGLVEGLLNLPVHRQVREDTAAELVTELNRPGRT